MNYLLNMGTNSRQSNYTCDAFVIEERLSRSKGGPRKNQPRRLSNHQSEQWRVEIPWSSIYKGVVGQHPSNGCFAGSKQTLKYI